MKRFLSFLLVLVCVVGTTSAQLLYKISGNGLTKPSYIMGTYHFKGIENADNVKHLQSVVMEVEQFCGELDLENMAKVEKLQQSIKVDSLPNGQTIVDIFNYKQFCKINQLLKNELGIDFFANPELLNSVGRLQPAALIGLLNAKRLFGPIMDKVENGQFMPIDVSLLLIGHKLGKPTIGLETAEFQIELLTRKASIKQQKKLVMEAVDAWELGNRLLSMMSTAYDKQDMTTIAMLVQNKNLRSILFGGNSTYKEILSDRDAAWVKCMPAIMAQKSTFFFVGIGHMAGKPGVLGHLRKMGYKVEPMQ